MALITCCKCGHGGGTLRRMRDWHGRKLKPASYEHEVCPLREAATLTKDEVLALRQPVKEVGDVVPADKV